MKGEFKYKTLAGTVITVDDSTLVPSSARDLVKVKFDDVPNPPHSDEDHEKLEDFKRESERLNNMIYGFGRIENRRISIKKT